MGPAFWFLVERNAPEPAAERGVGRRELTADEVERGGGRRELTAGEDGRTFYLIAAGIGRRCSRKLQNRTLWLQEQGEGVAANCKIELCSYRNKAKL